MRLSCIAATIPRTLSQIITRADGYKKIKAHASRWTETCAEIMEDNNGHAKWEQETMDNATTRRELTLRQLHNKSASTFTDCASDPCITVLVLRYCHSSQAMSGNQVMGSDDIRHNQNVPINNPTVEDDRVCALQSDHLHTGNHLSRHVLKANGDLS